MKIKTLNPLPEQAFDTFDRDSAADISFESVPLDKSLEHKDGIDVNTDTRFMSPKHKAYYEELSKHGFRLLDMSDGFLDEVEDNEIAEFAAKETMMIEEANRAVSESIKKAEDLGLFESSDMPTEGIDRLVPVLDPSDFPDEPSSKSDNLSQLNPSSSIPAPEKKHYMGENDAEYMSFGDGKPFEASAYDKQPVVEHVKHAANLEFDVVNGDYQGALDAALKEHPEIGSKYNNWNGHEPNISAKASTHEVDNPVGTKPSIDIYSDTRFMSPADKSSYENRQRELPEIDYGSSFSPELLPSC